MGTAEVDFSIPLHPQLFCGALWFTITAETRRMLCAISSLAVDLLVEKRCVFLILQTLALTLKSAVNPNSDVNCASLYFSN